MISRFSAVQASLGFLSTFLCKHFHDHLNTNNSIFFSTRNINQSKTFIKIINQSKNKNQSKDWFLFFVYHQAVLSFLFSLLVFHINRSRFSFLMKKIIIKSHPAKHDQKPMTDRIGKLGTKRDRRIIMMPEPLFDNRVVYPFSSSYFCKVINCSNSR